LVGLAGLPCDQHRTHINSRMAAVLWAFRRSTDNLSYLKIYFYQKYQSSAHQEQHQRVVLRSHQNPELPTIRSKEKSEKALHKAPLIMYSHSRNLDRISYKVRTRTRINIYPANKPIKRNRTKVYISSGHIEYRAIIIVYT